MSRFECEIAQILDTLDQLHTVQSVAVRCSVLQCVAVTNSRHTWSIAYFRPDFYSNPYKFVYSNSCIQIRLFKFEFEQMSGCKYVIDQICLEFLLLFTQIWNFWGLFKFRCRNCVVYCEINHRCQYQACPDTDVVRFRGYTQLFCGYAGLFYGCVGLFWSCHRCQYQACLGTDVVRFRGYTQLFCGYVGLFCGDVGLFCGDVGLFCTYNGCQGEICQIDNKINVSRHICGAFLQIYTALLRICRALLRICRALLRVYWVSRWHMSWMSKWNKSQITRWSVSRHICGALVQIYTALLRICRAPLRKCRALLRICRALLSISWMFRWNMS